MPPLSAHKSTYPVRPVNKLQIGPGSCQWHNVTSCQGLHVCWEQFWESRNGDGVTDKNGAWPTGSKDWAKNIVKKIYIPPSTLWLCHVVSQQIHPYEMFPSTPNFITCLLISWINSSHAKKAASSVFVLLFSDRTKQEGWNTSERLKKNNKNLETTQSRSTVLIAQLNFESDRWQWMPRKRYQASEKPLQTLINCCLSRHPTGKLVLVKRQCTEKVVKVTSSSENQHPLKSEVLWSPFVLYRAKAPLKAPQPVPVFCKFAPNIQRRWWF